MEVIYIAKRAMPTSSGCKRSKCSDGKEVDWEDEESRDVALYYKAYVGSFEKVSNIATSNTTMTTKQDGEDNPREEEEDDVSAPDCKKSKCGDGKEVELRDYKGGTVGSCEKASSITASNITIITQQDGEDNPREEEDDDVSVPDYMLDDQKLRFTAFVKWYRTNYHALGSKLDPDNVEQLQPSNGMEAAFLNFLMFYDKYYSKRAPFEWAERNKREHPFMAGPGTDYDFHALAGIYVQYDADYFVDNTDVKGKTKEELAILQERPWKPYPTGDEFSDESSDD